MEIPSPLHYSFRLVTGFLRAFFLSGGWLWRAPLLVGLVPPFKESAQPMLEFFGIGLWPSWAFYVIAAAAAVFILASRITYLETPRLRFGDLSCVSENSQLSIRLPVRNISWKEVKVVAYLEIRDENGKPLPGCDDSFVILPSKRLDLRRAKGSPGEPGPFILRSKAKSLVIAEFKPGNEHLIIPHESDDMPVPLGDFRMIISVDGAGITKREIDVSRDGSTLTLASKKKSLTIFI